MSKVTKRELLEEIWKSKLSYCQVHEAEYINPSAIIDHTFDGKPRLTVLPVFAKLDEIATPNVTVRHDTDKHIPLSKSQGKGKHGHLEGQINFVPFILYRSHLDPKGKLAFREVARSHHRNGIFTPSPPRSGITNKLAAMLMTMVEGYSRKGNWRGYSWIEDMGSEALVNLTMNVLKFDESKSDNPHAYITRCIETTFLRELKKQKRQGEIRDQMLMDSGMKPSFGAQTHK